MTKGSRAKTSMRGLAQGARRWIQIAVGMIRASPTMTVKTAISREKPKVLRNWGSANTCR